MSFLPRLRSISSSSKQTPSQSPSPAPPTDDDESALPSSSHSNSFSFPNRKIGTGPTRPQSTPPIQHRNQHTTSSSSSTTNSTSSSRPSQSRRSNSNTSPFPLTNIKPSSSTTTTAGSNLISPIPKRNFGPPPSSFQPPQTTPPSINLQPSSKTSTPTLPPLTQISSTQSSYSNKSDQNYYPSPNSVGNEMDLIRAPTPTVNDAVYSFKLLDALRKGE